MRLLFILTGMAEAVEGKNSTGEATHKFYGELRLMKLDFFVRYPDYLANHLLNLYESNSEPELLEAAKSIMIGEEPDIRTILMVRWKYGAYERIETALSILETPGLIKTVRDTTAHGRPWTYLIFESAFKLVSEATIQQPSLAWYARQIEAIKLLPNMNGSELKEAQYAIPEYENAAIGRTIPRIKEKVIKRLETLDVK
ncbi:hypothetical protein [Phaeobacter inhibens]|uniref:hypothetical protein n=1 Tax=Phaeobacter inhibens TaxID=221822 RepID=UPI0012EBF5F6|nr:hypothetical protein [Phaeobacter inhibens]